jgi:YHS domain-containing protein
MACKNNKPMNLYIVTFLTVLVLASLAMAALMHHSDDAVAGQGQISDRSRICMLQDIVQPRCGLTYVYNGKKYYLCCAGCLAGSRQDPQAHSHAVDPIDGKFVEKANAPAYNYHGHAYFFSSVANVTKFAGDPAKFIGGISRCSAPN